MSQENVELAYQAADALNRRDLDAFLSLCDSHLEFHSRLVELEGGEPYRGHDGIRSWWENLLRVFPDFSTENEEVRDLGDMTLTRTRVRGHGTESDAPWEQTQWHVVEWRHKKNIRWRVFMNEADALEAAGLRE
jgi:ketosteroid isomerase-like protein